MDIIPKLEADLKALGNSSSEISKSLSDKNITGSKCESAYCPVANYLISIGYSMPEVSQETIIVRLKEDHTINTPIELIDFILEFDDGKYPELERK